MVRKTREALVIIALPVFVEPLGDCRDGRARVELALQPLSLTVNVRSSRAWPRLLVPPCPCLLFFWRRSSSAGCPTFSLSVSGPSTIFRDPLPDPGGNVGLPPFPDLPPLPPFPRPLTIHIVAAHERHHLHVPTDGEVEQQMYLQLLWHQLLQRVQEIWE